MLEIKKNYNGAFGKEKETKLITPESFVNIQGWMITHLKLKGNPLIIYAIIYGFCQTPGQFFTGSVRYLAEWTNSTKRGVYKNLKELVDKGLIIKIEENINGVKFCKYTICEDYLPSRMSQNSPVMKKVHQGGEQSSGGGEQSSPNNIDNNIENNIVTKKEKLKKEKRRKCDSDELINVIDNYTNNEEIKELLSEFVEVRTKMKKPLTSRSFKRALKELDKVALENGGNGTDEEKIKIIERSVINSWQSFYSLNGQSNKKSRKLFDKPSYDLEAYEELDGITEFGKSKNKDVFGNDDFVTLDELERKVQEERNKKFVDINISEDDFTDD